MRSLGETITAQINDSLKSKSDIFFATPTSAAMVIRPVFMAFRTSATCNLRLSYRVSCIPRSSLGRASIKNKTTSGLLKVTLTGAINIFQALYGVIA